MMIIPDDSCIGNVASPCKMSFKKRGTHTYNTICYHLLFNTRISFRAEAGHNNGENCNHVLIADYGHAI